MSLYGIRIQSAYRRILTERKLITDFEQLLNALLYMFSESFPLIRARVVKTVSILTKIDPNLILRDIVRQSVSERFDDVAISVREEAVKLVGGFVHQGSYSIPLKSYSYITVFLYCHILILS